MAFARARSNSAKSENFEGEQLLAELADGANGVLMVDDMRTATPLLPNCAAAVIETSAGNYQHFYKVDRNLGLVQRVEILAELGGDPGARAAR